MAREFKGVYNFTSKKIVVNLDIIKFIQDKKTMVYCPALDLTGYGENTKEAESSFKESMAIYFDYTHKKNTLLSDLKRLGWKVTRAKNKSLTPPPLSTMLNTNENFSNIFNNHPFRKYNTELAIPLAV